MLCLFCSQQSKAWLPFQSLATQHCSAPISLLWLREHFLTAGIPFYLSQFTHQLNKVKNCYRPCAMCFLCLQLRTELFRKHRWRNHNYSYPPFLTTKNDRKLSAERLNWYFFQSCLLLKGAIAVQQRNSNHNFE